MFGVGPLEQQASSRAPLPQQQFLPPAGRAVLRGAVAPPPTHPPLGADLVARSLPGNAVLLDGHLLPSHRQLLKEKININKLSRLLRLMPYIASLSLPMQQKLTYHNIYNPYGSSSLCGSNGLRSKYICSLSAEQTTLG